MNKRSFWSALPLLFLAACAGMDRSCASCNASAFGADWVIVQYPPGQPPNCWVLHDASVSNEVHSDGIYWKDPATGHLVHIAGTYARVQVTGGDFAGAARLLSVPTCPIPGTPGKDPAARP